MLNKFSYQAKKSMEGVVNLRQQRNMLLEERFVALAKERLAIQQISQTETQQMSAAENEDYDLADRLQMVLEGHQREKAECTAIMDNIGRALKELDQQTPKVVDAVKECFENVGKELKEFQQKQNKEEHKDDSDAMDRFSKTSKQLSSEDERLKSELKHLERDEEIAQEERTRRTERVGYCGR